MEIEKDGCSFASMAYLASFPDGLAGEGLSLTSGRG